MSTLAVVEDKKADLEQVFWKEFEDAVTKYRVLSATTRTIKVEEKTPEKKTVEKQAVRRLVFAGLRVKLSEVLAEIAAEGRATPPNGISSLVIYADTLVLDTVAEIAAHNIAVVARSIDAKALGASPITLRVLTQLHDFVLEEQKDADGKPVKDKDGKPVLVEKPGNRLKQSVQILAGSIDGTLHLAAKKDNTPLNGRWEPKGGLPLGIELCRMDENGRLEPERKTTAREVADLVKRPLALIAFKAAFAAAAYLARFDEEKKTQQAVDMLRWVEVCLRSASAAANEDELLFEELADQVSSLLIPLEVTGNAFFVPTLSAEFYRAQVDQLLGALESYEGQLRDLEIRTDIGKSLEAVSGGMRDAAQMEIRPLKTELSMVRENMRVLEQSIIELNRNFRVQSSECRKLYDKLDVAIRDVMDKNLISEGFKLATDGISFLFSFQKMLITKSTKDLRGVNVTPMPGDGPQGPGSAPASMDDTDFDLDFGPDAGSSPSGDKTEAKTPLLKPGPQTPEQLFDEQNLQRDKSALLDALKKYGLQAVQMAEAFAKILQGTGADDAMIGKAHQLLLDQQKLTTTVIEAARTWEKALWSDLEVPNVPETLNAHRIDPGQKWDDFLREADVSLKGLPAQKAAAAYLSGLTMLAEFGKAINAKIIVYCEQIARGTVLKAQIAATTQITAAWQSQEARSQSELEKLAALKGMIQVRVDSIRQSIYVAWTYYRNSYIYLYFRKPPVVITQEMSASQLRDGLNGVSRWVAKLLGEDGASNAVTMPSRQAKIVFELPVVKSGEAAPHAERVARLEPATETRGAELRWTIPLGGDLAKGEENPLAGVLPQGGDVAIWVEEAKLVLDGVKPNDKGNGIVWLGTSGHYQNGFGRREAYSFVNRPIGAYYCFRGQEAYVPWTVQAGVYQMPTPFTQWKATFDKHGGDASGVTKLRLELVVSFRGRS